MSGAIAGSISFAASKLRSPEAARRLGDCPRWVGCFLTTLCAPRTFVLRLAGIKVVGWGSTRGIWRSKCKPRLRSCEAQTKKAFDRCEGRKSVLRYSSSYFFFAAFFFVAFFFIGMVMFLLVERSPLGCRVPASGAPVIVGPKLLPPDIGLSCCWCQEKISVSTQQSTRTETATSGRNGRNGRGWTKSTSSINVHFV